MSYEDVYNTYLSVSRGAKGKPWRARKDFSNFGETGDAVCCMKLDNFFKKFPKINVREFFLAPYTLYSDEEHFPLSFYNSQKAIATYTKVQKMKLEQSPDSEDHIADIKKTLRHIATVCFYEKMSLEEYCQKGAGYVTQPFVDFTENKVNIYVLISLPFFDEQLSKCCNQDKQIYLGDSYDDIGKFKVKLYTSTRAKGLIANGFKLIKQIKSNQSKQTN